MAVLTVKNLDDDVLARLAEVAASEGRSVQDLAREALTRSAHLPVLRSELATRRAERTPLSWREFEAYRAKRRRAG